MVELSPHLHRLLAEFVNRDEEFGRFQRMLDTDEPGVFCVWGGGGVGKSALQAKMIHEVALRGRAKAEVVWTDIRNHDLMAICRKVRDDLGPQYFSAFTDLVNFFTVPQYELKVSLEGVGNISVAEGASFSGSSVGDIAGVMVKDIMLNAPRNDMSISESERRARLTDAFVAGMALALKARQAVMFFDATEKMSDETQAWVFGELLPAACQGRMECVKFVLCGRAEPVVDRLWRDSFALTELRPLSRDHIIMYLERRGVFADDCEAIADLLLEFCPGGDMLSIATYVDGYLKRQEQRATRKRPSS